MGILMVFQLESTLFILSTKIICHSPSKVPLEPQYNIKGRDNPLLAWISETEINLRALNLTIIYNLPYNLTPPLFCKVR